MASLIDVFGRLLLEDGGKQFVADAARAGDEAGAAASRTMGSRVKNGLSLALTTGTKLLGAGAAAAFGIATKGALEMENATARYRAETGATAEEAKAAMTAVNAIAGRQRASLEAVTDVAIRVKRDLGAVGAEADKLTEDFVRFARVTKQDAAGAVSAFDDILDAWGLQASDAGTIMDALVVSGQKFGGAIADDQQALAALAPSLKAANLQWQDGVALLDIFKASGVDSTAAVTGMTKALGKVKSPAELQRLIEDISSTADPFERAQKAADLFGAKAGPKLANALAGKHLEDFAIDMDDAAGATQRAADVLDSTFSAQVQRKISEVGAALRGLGADFGPAVTGAASLAALGGSLGLDKLLAKGFGKLAGSALVKGAAAASGAALGLVFNTAVFAAEKAQSLAASMFSSLPGSSRITGAVKGAGGALGGSLGTVAAAAMAVVLIAAVYETYNQIKQGLAEQTAGIDAEVAEATRKQTSEQLAQTKATIEKGLADINGVWDAGLFTTDSRKALEANLASVNAEIERRAQQLPVAAAAGIEAGTPTLTAAAGGMWDDLHAEGEAKARPSMWQDMGAAIPVNLADGIRSKRDAITGAMQQLIEDLKNAMSPAKEEANLLGQLTSKALAKGLRSKDPEVRAQAEYTKQLILGRLLELVNNGQPLGKKAMKALRDGLHSGNPAVRTAAQQVQDAVEKKFGGINGKGAGRSADSGLASGLRGNKGTPGAAAATVGNTIARNIIAGVSAATNIPLSSFHLRALAEGGRVRRGEPVIVGEGGRPELFIPDVPGTVVPAGDNAARSSSVSTTSMASITVNVHPGSDVGAVAAQRFGRAVAREVASAFRQGAARRGIAVAVRP